MKLPLGVQGKAYPTGRQAYRHWLSRTWNSSEPVALIIGINPNTATESEDDSMTNFLIELLRGLDGEYKCGGYILVNCCDFRHRQPKELDNVVMPCSETNIHTVEAKLLACDFVVASWGTTKYGKAIEDGRVQMASLVEQSKKRVICFSPRGVPIYCGRRNRNSTDGRWSSKPIPCVL